MSRRKKQPNADHVRRHNMPGPDNEVVEARLEELLTPAVYGQLAYYRSLGLRHRVLGLPLMIAAVLTMLWRQVPSVCVLCKMLAREDLLWARAVKVSQQALSKRFLVFPAEMFERVLLDLLPTLHKRWQERRRPLPESIVLAQKHFSHLLVVDASTLEALFRKLKSLQELPTRTLAGKICTVIDLPSRLPEQIWFREEAKDNEAHFVPQILDLAQAATLLIFDRGFVIYSFFDDLIAKGAAFITRFKPNSIVKVQKVLLKTATVQDQIVKLGCGPHSCCQHQLRLIKVRFGRVWYSYLSSVLDPAVLPAEVVADLYRRRWRIEESFAIVKRLLGLSYLWTGSINGVLLQVWATWLFYAILLDLGDAVAEELMLPFDRISLEMVFRGLYHFSQAYQKGKATDPIKYLAAPENRDLGAVKRLRKKPSPVVAPT
jgi:hypothetical protein